jgi:hypothetical protein
MSEKSILEQALLQVNTLEEAVKQNAKGILSSVMKQELNELLKESEEEEKQPDPFGAEASPEEEESQDMSEQPADDEEAGEEDDEEMPSINDEPSKDIDGEESDMEDDEFSADDEAPEEEEDEFPSMDDMSADDDDTLDMTGAADDEVLKVFKAMSDEDGIIVKKDGNNIELSDADDEYIIKLDESDVSAEDEMSEEWNEEEESDDDETIYEIELDDEPEAEAEMSEEDMPAEEEVDEAARTKWNVHGGDRAGLKSKKVFAAGAKHESKQASKAINEEVENLRKQNGEYKKALVMFKDKLNEVAVFNANLAYATRLFTEHSTTKQEKLNILKRFDSISTINESKNLYNSIKAELDTKKPVTETVVDKIANTASTSSSQEVLSESKAYEAPQFRRMRDLMSKLK